jgi:hypothetical protein
MAVQEKPRMSRKPRKSDPALSPGDKVLMGYRPAEVLRPEGENTVIRLEGYLEETTVPTASLRRVEDPVLVDAIRDQPKNGASAGLERWVPSTADLGAVMTELIAEGWNFVAMAPQDREMERPVGGPFGGTTNKVVPGMLTLWKR